jgi:predicted choloylglycine hydrolase
MLTITLRGTARERGIAQGSAFRRELHALLVNCPVWLGNMPPGQVARVRDTMFGALGTLCPQMVEELEGIAQGADMSLQDVALINFVSAIGALAGCSNLIVQTAAPDGGPILAKTSDIGDDAAYYSLQRVEPDHGHAYLAISWAGCLWAEVGVNAAGLAAGQSSAPTMPGQEGFGIPTLEYPRVILEQCATIAEAVEFCEETPMAGKGLNIALADASGDAAVVEKSGTRTAVRWLSQAVGAIFCTNHFLDPSMEGMKPLSIPGITGLTENSVRRMDNMARFLVGTRHPTMADLKDLLARGIDDGGLYQDEHPALTTHYAYLVLPVQREMQIGEGTPCHRIEYTSYSLRTATGSGGTE